MDDQTSRLLAILQLETVGPSEYRGENEQRGYGRLFGGQVLAQALRAAQLTCPADRHVHSLHGYFLVGGNPALPIDFRVEQLRDGKSFSARRVTARQAGQAIFTLDSSFHVREAGLAHQEPMPEVALPESLEDDLRVEVDDLEQAHWNRRQRPFDMRSLFGPGRPRSAGDQFWNPVWIKFRGELPAVDPDSREALRRCLLAYASDMGIVSTGIIPHSVRRARVMMASLDHAMWFHGDVPLDDWLLFVKRTVQGANGRTLNRGSFYSRGGDCVASCAQEGLMRVIHDAAPGQRRRRTPRAG